MSNLTRLRRQHPEIPADQPLCSMCGEINDRRDQRYCSGCHAGYMREWRKHAKDYEPGANVAAISREANVSRLAEDHELIQAVTSLDEESLT